MRGEGGDGEKRKRLRDQLKNEEKGESSEWKATSHIRTYESTLPFLHAICTSSLPCTCNVYAWHVKLRNSLKETQTIFTDL